MIKLQFYERALHYRLRQWNYHTLRVYRSTNEESSGG